MEGSSCGTIERHSSDNRALRKSSASTICWFCCNHVWISFDVADSANDLYVSDSSIYVSPTWEIRRKDDD